MNPDRFNQEATDFPEVQSLSVDTLQVNLGYLCNQQCMHCHVNAGPWRREVMDSKTVGQLIQFLTDSAIRKLDLTGGAPEMNPHFKDLVRTTYKMGVHLIDRCNLTILEEPGQRGLAEFLGDHGVEIIASLPCFLEENVDSQRGRGTYRSSVFALKRLNRLGYGKEDSGLVLNLVYNPLGPFLPPPQLVLEEEYRKELGERYGITFNHLFTITNMPIQRFGHYLISTGAFEGYIRLLRNAHRQENLDSLMCRSLISIDWEGYLYNCDFNQALGLPMSLEDRPRLHISELTGLDLERRPITVRNHCYGCTAGQGSSCSGALTETPALDLSGPI